MFLKDYMQTYKRGALTKMEIQFFGLPDTKSGWKLRYQYYTISDAHLRALQTTSTLKKSYVKMAKTLSKEASRKESKLAKAAGRTRYLYLMQNLQGHVKIGISYDVLKRARALTTSSGSQVRVIAFWKTEGNVEREEKRLLKLFKVNSLEGEWFKSGSVTIEMIENNSSCILERVQGI